MTDLAQPFVNARPRFRVQDSARSDLDAALLEMRVHQPLSGMASAELRFVNWRGDSTGASADFAFQTLELGHAIDVLGGADTTLFSGEITALEERHGDGAPQLVVLAEDRLHRLARQRHNRSFENTGIADVVSRVAGEGGLNVSAGLDAVHGSWHQINESNLAFLLRLLEPYDLALRMDGDALRIKREEPDSQPVSLHTQNNVHRLRIIADLNHQPRKVLVRGFDLASDDPVRSDCDSLTPAAQGTSATDTLAELSWGEEEIFPQPLARNRGEAEAWARGRFQHRAKRFLHGDILCTGIAELRSGREIDLRGTSPRLLGKYQVVDCWHAFNAADGYVTRIKVQRSGWDS